VTDSPTTPLERTPSETTQLDKGTPDQEAPAVRGARPRIRSGAIAWGLIVMATAGGVLFALADPARRAAFTAWLTTLTPGGAILVGVIALGTLLLLLGVLAVIRRAQRPEPT
jgi:hypothetical protein